MCLGTVLLKDEEFARYLEYGKKQLLLIVVTFILNWLSAHADVLTYRYTTKAAWHRQGENYGEFQPTVDS